MRRCAGMRTCCRRVFEGYCVRMSPLRFLLALLLISIVGCHPRESGEAESAAGFVIEVLRHGDEGPEPLKEVTDVAVGSGFEVEGTEMMVTDRWEHAVSQQETSDDNPEESHAFEIAWQGDDGGEVKRWLHQSDPGGPATLLDGLPVAIRIAPPGARPAEADTEDFASQVQFLHKGGHHDLPEVGAEVFEGWNLKSSRRYQSALMDEDGSVEEAEDAGFVNRVLEVHVVTDDGSEERHIVFLDHPELTKGIHPTILPVSRVSGEKTSLARLVVCPPMPRSDEKHQVWVTPGTGEGESSVQIAGKEGGDRKVVRVAEFPAEIEVGEGVSVKLLRQFTHAKSVVRWEKAEPAEGDDARPALVVEHWEGREATRLVLIEGEITPCRIGGEMVMLRFRK